MPNLLPIAPGIILKGMGEWVGATCLAPWLMSIFLAFAAFWLVRGGSRSSLEVEFQKCDLPCARRVALLFGGRIWEVRPALRKAGRAFLWEASFCTLLGWSGRDLDANEPDFEEVRPALRKVDRALGVRLQGSKKCWKMEVLRMTSSIVENVPTPRETIFKLSPASQLPYRAKIKKCPTFEN